MLKQPVQVAVTLPGLVTVTSLGPVTAPPVIVTLAVIEVGEPTTVEATEMPAPENFTVAPCWNPSPRMTIACATVP